MKPNGAIPFAGEPAGFLQSFGPIRQTMQEQFEIDGVRLRLSHPHDVSGEWIGQGEILKQLLACWIVVDEQDLPLTPRLIGTPGIGKTALAMAGARLRKQELYIYQCTADTRPEDLLVTPVLAEHGKIAYHASPLVTAMVRGGVCILDEVFNVLERFARCRARLVHLALPTETAK